MPLKYNPVTGQLDLVNSATEAVIPQLNVDPVAPAAESAWVLHSGGGATIRAFLGLGFPYMAVGTAPDSYELSYRTTEGTTVRAALS